VRTSDHSPDSLISTISLPCPDVVITDTSFLS
jgi:hypothetical protein